MYHGDKINSDNSENTDLRAKPREGYEQRHFIEVYETLWNVAFTVGLIELVMPQILSIGSTVYCSTTYCQPRNIGL